MTAILSKDDRRYKRKADSIIRLKRKAADYFWRFLWRSTVLFLKKHRSIGRHLLKFLLRNQTIYDPANVEHIQIYSQLWRLSSALHNALYRICEAEMNRLNIRFWTNHRGYPSRHRCQTPDTPSSYAQKPRRQKQSPYYPRRSKNHIDRSRYGQPLLNVYRRYHHHITRTRLRWRHWLPLRLPWISRAHHRENTVCTNRDFLRCRSSSFYTRSFVCSC